MAMALESGALGAERDMLVRFCARYTGCPDVAEDLAQQTMLEAWRHQDDLRDPAARQSWLLSIARTTCAMWARRRKRDLSRRTSRDCDDLDSVSGQEADFDLELEREDIARLLERALTLLPVETRQVLTGRFVEELSQRDMAERLGVTEGAVEARLHRGKLALRRILSTELREEAEANGLILARDAGWQQTRLWCFLCGRRRLLGRVDADIGELVLRCEGCCEAVGVHVTHSVLPGVLKGVKGFRVASRRAATYLYEYNRRAMRDRSAQCMICGRPTLVNLVNPEPRPLLPRGERGVYMRCSACGAFNQSPLRYLALGLPELQAFWRRHPRLRLLPVREIKSGSRPALLTGAESVSGDEVFEVVYDRETCDLLAVHSGTRA